MVNFMIQLLDWNWMKSIRRSEKYQEIVEHKLALSDKVVNGDLLRFYTPENFTPIDRTKYNYNKYVM